MNGTRSLGTEFGFCFFFVLLVLILLFAFHMTYLIWYILACFIFIYAFSEIFVFFLRRETSLGGRGTFITVCQRILSPLLLALLALFWAIIQPWLSPIPENPTATRIFFLFAFALLFSATSAAILSIEQVCKNMNDKKKIEAEKELK